MDRQKQQLATCLFCLNRKADKQTCTFVRKSLVPLPKFVTTCILEQKCDNPCSISIDEYESKTYNSCLINYSHKTATDLSLYLAVYL